MASPLAPLAPPPSYCWRLLVSMAAIAAYILLIYTNYGQILIHDYAYGGLLAGCGGLVPITIIILMRFYHNRVINSWFVRRNGITLQYLLLLPPLWVAWFFCGILERGVIML
ncbi:hypothetical protein ACH5RR_037795 [Cinchona calisaya]|uniref:Uncharacterized protein n=1 Tax=Cinchona calisaya TaxID=153742 RepID=A0ABD2Y778_9GENT